MSLPENIGAAGLLLCFSSPFRFFKLKHVSGTGASFVFRSKRQILE